MHANKSWIWIKAQRLPNCIRFPGVRVYLCEVRWRLLWTVTCTTWQTNATHQPTRQPNLAPDGTQKQLWTTTLKTSHKIFCFLRSDSVCSDYLLGRHGTCCEWQYTNIDWCRGQQWKIMPWSCVMLPEGRRPEGNIAQLRCIIFQCWNSRYLFCYITIQITTIFNIVISRKKHSALCLTGLFKPVIHTLSTLCSNFFKRLYYVRILKFFKVCKGQKKMTYKPF